MHEMTKDAGATVISQSKQNIIPTTALNVCMRMAHQYDILDSKPSSSHQKLKKIDDSYVDGFRKIQRDYAVDPLLSRFKTHLTCDPIINSETMLNEEAAECTEDPPNNI